jgi:hypothetical protein
MVAIVPIKMTLVIPTRAALRNPEFCESRNVSRWRERDHRQSPMVRNLQFNLLSNPESLVHFDAKVADGAFKLSVTKWNMHGSEVARLL